MNMNGGKLVDESNVLYERHVEKFEKETKERKRNHTKKDSAYSNLLQLCELRLIKRTEFEQLPLKEKCKVEDYTAESIGGMLQLKKIPPRSKSLHRSIFNMVI